MTFRIEYAEKMLQKLTYYIKRQMTTEMGLKSHWETNIHVSKYWHFNIRYELNKKIDSIHIVHKNRNGHMVIVENGKFIKHVGIRRFDMLFAALNEDLISMLKNGSTIKITRKKLNERYLTKTPYFWSKIEYYLQKKENLEVLFGMLGDIKYKTRKERIEKAIQFYAKEKKKFIENTKNLSLS